MEFENLAKSKKTRLEFIEFLLQFRGWLTRKDVTAHFDTGLAGTSKDIALYRALTTPQEDPHQSDNFTNSDSSKRYEIKDDTFKPLFHPSTDKALNFLRIGALKDGLGAEEPLSIDTPPRLGMPNIDLLATISRAVLNQSGLSIDYFSIKNGHSSRIIFPHSIVDTGLKWHIRAFCTKKNIFCDFIISRIKSAELARNKPIKSQSIELDEQWHRMVKLELRAHPNKENVDVPETIEFEHDMIDGVKTISIRAAVAGYWLRLWNVDCTKNHKLKGKNHQLWLSNVETLYGVNNAFLAPGYERID